MVGSCINCVLIEGMNNEGRATLCMFFIYICIVSVHILRV